MAVGQAKATVGQADQARRVAFAQVGCGSCVQLPAPGVVGRTVGLDPVPGSVMPADGREQLALDRAARSRA